MARERRDHVTQDVFSSLIGMLVCSTLMTLAFTLLTAESELFRPLRNWCLGSGPHTPWYRRCPDWITDLIHCPFCTSWWHAGWTTGLVVWVLQMDIRYWILFPAAVGATVWQLKVAAKPSKKSDDSIESLLKQLDDRP